MNQVAIPALWLLVLIVGLPQISETIYTPALPDIAKAFNVVDSMVEYTLTIYLLGFAIGTLFWGWLSDKWGRRLCMLMGLGIYLIGCIGCFFSSSIVLLLISRFVQAFGGSTGSVLGQAICRDVFHGRERGKVYAIIGSTLAFSPAIGPIMGGLIDQSFGWSAIFLLLIVLGIGVLLLTYRCLPETHLQAGRIPITLVSLACKMMRDWRVLFYGFLVGACNGIQFSYYAEGSFVLIDILGLTPFGYGVSFVGLAAAGMAGGWLSRHLHDYLSSFAILGVGVWLLFAASTFFAVGTYLHTYYSFSDTAFITFIIVTMMLIMMSISLMVPSLLSAALQEYKATIGTASSLFGFFYYGLISLFTLGMGLLHNGTLIRMPFYFLGISLGALVVYAMLVKIERIKVVFE